MWNFVKYNLIGIVNTGITLVTVWILYELLHWNLELSNFLGFVAGGVNSYIMNRRLNFKSKNSKRSEVVRFAIVFLAAYLVNLFVLESLKDSLPSAGDFLSAGYLANILANAAYVVVSYALYRYFVFRKKN
ncbi:MAG: GtrA family protein [Fibrobacter sp.]|nr:GtrA family protein [Fibrobacter sp.]